MTSSTMGSPRSNKSLEEQRRAARIRELQMQRQSLQRAIKVLDRRFPDKSGKSKATA